MKDFLQKFCEWSGQEINFQKLGIFLPKNTPNIKWEVKQVLGFKKLKKVLTHLGDPLILNKEKYAPFNYLHIGQDRRPNLQHGR